MGTWLAVEVVVAVLSAVLWGEPAPADSKTDCGRGTVEVECEGEGGRGDGEQGAG